MMPSSLRKRLSKRRGKDDLRSPSASEDEAISRPSSRTSTPSSELEGAITFDDLSSTPPLPKGEGTIRPVSPSSSAINRYKLRTPAAVAPSVMSGDQDVYQKLGRDTAFSEQFDDDTSPPVSGPNSAPGTPVLEKADSVQIASGNTSLLIASTIRPTGKRSKSAEVLPNRITKQGEQLLDIKPPTRQRSTRSQARREQRADSGAGELEAAMVEVKKPREIYVSWSPMIRKLHGLPRTPSPGAEDQIQQQPRASGSDTGATPANSPNFSRPRVPAKQHPINFCRNNSRSPPDVLTVFPSPDDVPASHSPDHLTGSPRHTPSPTHDHQQSSRAKAGNSGEKDSGSVVVNPPRFDPTRLPAYQWVSHLGSTSRPEQPWSWMKKWTCCHCHAQTMVEQRDCAHLECKKPMCKTVR